VNDVLCTHCTINSYGKRITGVFTGDPKWLDRIFGNSVWRDALVCQPLAKADSFAVTFDNSLKMPPPNARPGPVGTGAFSFPQVLGDGHLISELVNRLHHQFHSGFICLHRATLDLKNLDGLKPARNGFFMRRS